MIFVKAKKFTLDWLEKYGMGITYMQCDCYIFSKYLLFQMENLVFQSKYLVVRSKTLDFDRNTRYFESEILKYKVFQTLNLE